jgi:N-acetylmuramoyl-L-alanine amidase
VTRLRPLAPGWRATGLAAAALAALAALLVSCTGSSGGRPEPVAQSAPTPTALPAPMAADQPDLGASSTTTSSAPPSRPPWTRPRAAPTPRRTGSPAPPRRPVVVVLDPGHNGGNASHLDIIDTPVYAGNGRTKPCNTVGTSTLGGYWEHAFNFDVALRTRALLARRGVSVLLTRLTDTGVGPCVDARARFGNLHAAAAVVAIHADGAAPAGHGFHIIEAAVPPAGATTAAASRRLALSVRGRLLAESGLSYATYLAGGTGLDERSDIAGLNLSTRPAILVECGNMQNQHDAALQADPAGRERIARALADGILAFLGLR